MRLWNRRQSPNLHNLIFFKSKYRKLYLVVSITGYSNLYGTSISQLIRATGFSSFSLYTILNMNSAIAVILYYIILVFQLKCLQITWSFLSQSRYQQRLLHIAFLTKPWRIFLSVLEKKTR